jgi:hypothetical protein
MSLEGWRAFFETGGVILLFLTFVFGAGAVLTSKRINEKQAEELRQFSLNLAAQQERAAKAEQVAAEAKSTAANANDRTLVLETDAANAKATQQRVETDLAKQQERAAKAEKDLLELQQRMKPRQLSIEEASHLKEALKASQIRGVIEVMCILGDSESKAFAVQLDTILKAAGWETTGVNEGIFSPANPTGMGIVVHSAISAPKYAAALQQSFIAGGVPLAGAENEKIPEGKVQLLIGIKPDKSN